MTGTYVHVLLQIDKSVCHVTGSLNSLLDIFFNRKSSSVIKATPLRPHFSQASTARPRPLLSLVRRLRLSFRARERELRRPFSANPRATLFGINSMKYESESRVDGRTEEGPRLVAERCIWPPRSSLYFA